MQHAWLVSELHPVSSPRGVFLPRSYAHFLSLLLSLFRSLMGVAFSGFYVSIDGASRKDKEDRFYSPYSFILLRSFSERENALYDEDNTHADTRVAFKPGIDLPLFSRARRCTKFPDQPFQSTPEIKVRHTNRHGERERTERRTTDDGRNYTFCFSV